MLYCTSSEMNDKGKLGGSCNVSACQAPLMAYWYNQSTKAYYCFKCAFEINEWTTERELKSLGYNTEGLVILREGESSALSRRIKDITKIRHALQTLSYMFRHESFDALAEEIGLENRSAIEELEKVLNARPQ